MDREDAMTTWDTPIESQYGSCYISIENKNGDEFGQILGLMREVVAWSSLRFSKDATENVFSMRFAFDSEAYAKSIKQ